MTMKKTLIASVTAAALMMPAASAMAQSDNANQKVEFLTQQQPSEQLVSNLMDVTVENSAGDELGDVNDLVIGKDGNLTGVVIGVGGFLGVGEKNVAVPYNSVAMKMQDEELVGVLDTTKSDLESAPDYRNVDNKPLSVSKRLTDEAKETYDKAKEQASETYEQAKQKASETYEKAKESVSDSETETQ